MRRDHLLARGTTTLGSDGKPKRRITQSINPKGSDGFRDRDRAEGKPVHSPLDLTTSITLTRQQRRRRERAEAKDAEQKAKRGTGD